MWLRILVLLGLLLGPCALPAPASAAESIAYSRDGQVYGWCAGYAASRATSCALDQCRKSGGKNCETALDCNGGYGAVAFAEDPAQVFGAVCGVGSAFTARSQALAACTVAARALCWTDSTFDAQGNDASSSDNEAFDLALYTQLLLQVRNYKVSNADGEIGPETRAAIRKFQAEIGLDATGETSDALLDRLLDAAQGEQQFARITKRDILDQRKDLADVTYVDAADPAPEQDFSHDLMQRSDADRRTALATVLSDQDTPCTLPAKSAEAIPDASSGIWDIVCDQGEYTLMLGNDGSTVIMSGGSTVEDDTGDKDKEQPAGSGQGSAGQTTGGDTSAGGTGQTGNDAQSQQQ